MPLSLPAVERTPQHIRQVTFRSFARADGLWDIEGELLDTKAIDLPRPNGEGVRKAGDPIHHMLIRTTIDQQLVVHAIEAHMESHPIQGCPGALQAMQRMVGCCMARGWRKAIENNLQGIQGCTHMRELLHNMATAAFQTIVSAFDAGPNLPPGYLGRCTGWDFEGPAVAQYYPQFIGWAGTPDTAAPPTSAPPPSPPAART